MPPDQMSETNALLCDDLRTVLLVAVGRREGTYAVCRSHKKKSALSKWVEPQDV
jgi:hypothetical protein